MIVNPSTALSEVRDWLFDHVRTGAKCPACGRRVKQDAYSIEKGWIDIMFLVLNDPDEWVHVQKFKTAGRKDSMLRHWGLLERRTGARLEDGNPNSGHYRITDLGRRFLMGLERVPRRILLYDGKFSYEDPDDLIDVYDAYGHRFNYEDFMRGEG